MDIKKKIKQEQDIFVYFVKAGELLQRVVRISVQEDIIINNLLLINSEKKGFAQLTTMNESGYRLVTVEENELYIWDNGKIKRIMIDEIVYLEACRCYCEIIMANDKKIVPSMSLHEVETFLPEDRFIRIHRTFTINRRYLKEISGNMVMMSDGKQLPIGRSYRKLFMNSLNIINTQNKKYF
jgi:DNA-binding LytR/AlgR family response regulator